MLIVAFQSGELRTPEGTTTEICRQISLVLGSGATEKLKSVTASTGVRDSITTSIVETLVDMGKKLRKRGSGKVPIPEADIRARLEQELNDYLGGTDMKDMINPLLGMKGECSGSSIIEYTSSNCTSRDEYHLDTPMEVLHTILLGVVKYFWGQTVFLLEKAKLLDLLQARLDSVGQDGLNVPPLNARYICQYKGGLNGKHFKSLAQVMPFLIYDIVPQTVLDAWSLISELVILIWHTQIDDTEKYLVNVDHFSSSTPPKFSWSIRLNSQERSTIFSMSLLHARRAFLSQSQSSIFSFTYLPISAALVQPSYFPLNDTSHSTMSFD